MALGNGQQTQYVYYTATQQGGRLYQIKTGTSGAPDGTQYLQYGYDRVGNVTVITDHNNTGQMQLFAYDALNRLTTAAAIGGLDSYVTRTYAYDAIGNVTLGDGGYYYYEGVRPHAVITVGNPPSSMSAYYGYDGNGSATFITRTLLSKTYALTYDPENRVKQVVPSDGPTAVFRYDGDGTRVLGIVGGVTTTYAGTWYEYSTTGVSYYYLNGQRVAMRNADGVTYIHRDHLGSAVTTTGVLTQGQRYDAWGETRGASTVDTPYRYTGQREEDDLLLYFYNARWYDAALGRFIQADSIVPEPGNPQSLNRYSYVLNNPLRHSDPSGHSLDDGFGVRWRYTPGGDLRAVDLFAPGAGQFDSDLTYFAVIEAQARATSADVAELALANRTLPGRRSSYPEFSALVGDGQRWDVKDKMKVQLGTSIGLCGASECGWYEYSVVGNILYGFTGDQAGFSPIELWLGAGYAEATDPENIAKQTGSKASPMLYLPMENLLYFGDNRQDFWAVNMGIALSLYFGADVNVQEFKALLAVFDDKLARGVRNEASYEGWPYAPGSFDHP